MILSLCFFLMGFMISFLTTPVVIGLAQQGFGLDRADETRKRHRVPTSRLGGMSIMFALSVGLLIILSVKPSYRSDWFPILLGSLLMFGLGLWDDFKPIGAKKKLIGQIAIAALVNCLGLSIDRVTYPGGAWSVELGGWSTPVTIFWLIAVPNIVNLIDGFDGLAGGLGMFMAVTLGIVGLLAEQLPVAWYAFTMAGALLGFLCFNFPPARIFLGDGGAYLIGFCIAAMSLTSSNKGSIAAVLLVTVIVLGIPILDTALALGRRALRGFPLFHADDEHIHHRLENLGFSKRRIVIGIYGICLVLSLVGLSIVWSQGRTIPIAIGVVFLMAMFALRYLHLIRNWGDLQSRVGRLIGRRRVVRYALLQAQLMELEVDRCAHSEEFWPIFRTALHRVGLVETPREMNERYLTIEVNYNGSTPWTLYAREYGATQFEWQRIAECFRPTYIKAKNKWHS